MKKATYTIITIWLIATCSLLYCNKKPIEGNTSSPKSSPLENSSSASDYSIKLVSYKELNSLINPSKLSALKKGNRSANVRFRKLMHWMHIYKLQGVPPKIFLENIYKQHTIKPYHNQSHVYAPVTEKLNLEAQYKLGKLYGLYTTDNLLLLRKGRAPTIYKGEYVGEIAEVDHLIPVKLASELENSMANLTWLSMSQNRKKSAKLTNSAKRRIKSISKETAWTGLYNY